MSCSQCGAAARGRFCGSCGASLRELRCGGCGGQVPPGTRFCTACGTPVRGGPASGSARDQGADATSGWTRTAGWWVSGGLGGVLIVVLGFTLFGDSDGGDAAPPAAAPAAPAGSAAGVDLSTMTPRDAADRLFDRVMTALATGDTVEAMNFLPMAFQAYDMARPLNEDGLYHVSVLRRAAEDHEGALEAALAGLEDNPNHILNLSSAAEAARDLGDAPAARGYYERLLEAWDEEMAQERPEYSNHAPLLPEIQQDARTFLDQDR